MRIRMLLITRRSALFGLLFIGVLTGEVRAALSGSTERIRRAIAEHDFPGTEPVMDAQHQFIVFSPDRRLSGALLGEVIKLRREIYHFFGITKIWDQPAFVLIFPTREKYGVRGTGGAAVQFRYRGQDVRIIASYLQEGLQERILPHEMVHFLISDLSNVGSASRGEPPRLPIFINEGIAEYFSSHHARRILFEKAVWEILQAGRLEPFKKIVTSTASWPEALMPGGESWSQRAQGYSVISFLASLPNGNVKLRNYILSYGTLGTRVSAETASLRAFEMAFRQDYTSWEGLQTRWVRYLRDKEIVVVEAESATVTGSSGEKCDVVKARGGQGLLSGEKGLLFRADKTGSFLALQGTMPAAGVYDVYAICLRGPRAGQSRLALNGKNFPGIFDGYARREGLSEPVYFGKATLAAGSVGVRFSVVGKNVISGGFELGVDCLLFRRDRRREEENRATAQERLQSGIDNYRRKRFREAEGDFAAAIELVPDNATALEWRAHTRMAMERWDEAWQDVEAAIKLDPQNQRLGELRKRIEVTRENARGEQELPPEPPQ